MTYADFIYYQQQGYPLISQDVFNYYSKKASVELAFYIQNKVTPDNIENSEYKEDIKKCMCELTVYFHDLDKDKEKASISSESVGPHSITINTKALLKDDKTIEKNKNRIIRLYLAYTGLLYRGI